MDYSKFLLRALTSVILLIFFSTFIIFYSNIIKYIIFFVYLVILIEIIMNFKFLKFITIIYLLISFFFIQYFVIFSYSLEKITLFILITLFFDTYSYLFGSFLGKRKIIPKISPNKTFEGLLYGYFATILTMLTIIFILDQNINFKLIIIINLTIIFSFFGDLFESYLKRKSKIKDSSKLIPGHGGFFDRFDSFILSSYLLPFWIII